MIGADKPSKVGRIGRTSVLAMKKTILRASYRKSTLWTARSGLMESPGIIMSRINRTPTGNKINDRTITLVRDFTTLESRTGGSSKTDRSSNGMLMRYKSSTRLLSILKPRRTLVTDARPALAPKTT